jgi:hypothetical protein
MFIAWSGIQMTIHHRKVERTKFQVIKFAEEQLVFDLA